MTKEEFAARLNGREYLSEITHDEAIEASNLGFVVVFGYSDDNLELRGAWSDEFSAYNGKELPITPNGPLVNECEDDDCPYFAKLKEATKDYINAKWDEVEGYAWYMESNLPYAPFDIMEDGEKFCRGIVIDLNSFKGEKE